VLKKALTIELYLENYGKQCLTRNELEYKARDMAGRNAVESRRSNQEKVGIQRESIQCQIKDMINGQAKPSAKPLLYPAVSIRAVLQLSPRKIVL
jgi:hypothetical protein